MSEPDSSPSLLDGPPSCAGRGDRIARLLLWPLLAALVVLVLVAYVFFSPVGVDGKSMEPTLHNGDRLLRTKSYSAPHRGDIVVYDAGADGELVKRIAAVAGDTVEIRDDVAIVNGVPEQPPGKIVLAPGYGITRAAITVPPGSVYLLGDNRPVSEDSRVFGTVQESRILGKVVLIFAPITRVRWVH